MRKFDALTRFVRDEQGGYTIWSLTWLSLYIAIGGLAVDMTDAYRNRTGLQATADAAALAGVMSLPDEGEVTYQALAVAGINLDSATNGQVLLAPEVVIGTWDFGSRSFAPGGADPNAVWVVTRRSEQNANPLGMNFLRILSLIGLDTYWNIATEAIAVKFIPGCMGSGLIARTSVKLGGNNELVNEVCIHGQIEGVTIQNGNEFASGVQVSMANLDDLKAKIDSNTGLGEALHEGDMWPKDVDRLPEIFEGLIPGADGRYTEVPSAIYYPDGSDPTFEVIRPNYAGEFKAHHVYYVDCANDQEQINLPTVTVQPVFEKLVVYSECRIHGDNMGQVEDIVLASIATGSGSSPLDKTVVHLSGQADVGTQDGCAPDGGIEIYAAASASVAAGGDIIGLRAIVAGDFEMTAGGGGVNGIDVEAGDEIRLTSNNVIGACPGNNTREHAWHFRLVH